MKYIKSLLLVSAVVGLSSSVMASQMRVESNSGIPGLDAAGASLSVHGASAFNFEVGTFGAFAPASGNIEQWGANWAFSGLESPWIVSGPFANRVRNQLGLTDPSFTGQQGFVWGYDDKMDLAAGQWILVTNAAWVFPALDALQLPGNIAPENVWNLNSAGNQVLFGSFVDGNPESGFQLQAIPEPSTYALIFSLGILGFLGFRRFRK